MALMPDSLRFTPEEESQLEKIRTEAKKRHAAAAKAAARKGRHFPALPYECSAAYEHEFLRNVRR